MCQLCHSRLCGTTHRTIIGIGNRFLLGPELAYLLVCGKAGELRHNRAYTTVDSAPYDSGRPHDF